ncbi:hypothetical protein Psuf_077850 [Phytohabitans suffuscus]|uniref:Uncharacterized protein n=1 Tax=Phytohabitans suffuscus TaxID=624315 RepID=A0A6F8YWK0_9ACTN|nr:hypothetical protein Psuf_077850 [Phytohabitans suffuscus]
MAQQQHSSHDPPPYDALRGAAAGATIFYVADFYVAEMVPAASRQSTRLPSATRYSTNTYRV